MTSLQISDVGKHLRRLALGSAVAASAVVGGSAFNESTLSCAEAQSWDPAAYQECAIGYEAQKEDDYVSWYEGVKSCCKSFGGVWHDQQPGQEARCDAPKPRFIPPIGGINEVLEPDPAPPPVRQPPGMIPDTLAPIAPG